MFPLLCWWTGIFMLRGSPSNSPRLSRESPLGHRARQVFTLSSVPLASRWPSILENIKLLCGSEAIDKYIALGNEEFVFLWVGRGKVGMGGGATLYTLFQQLQVFLKVGLWCRFKKKNLSSGTLLLFSHSKAILLWPATSNIQPSKQKRSILWLSWSFLCQEARRKWGSRQDFGASSFLRPNYNSVEASTSSLGYNQEQCPRRRK